MRKQREYDVIVFALNQTGERVALFTKTIALQPLMASDKKKIK